MYFSQHEVDCWKIVPGRPQPNTYKLRGITQYNSRVVDPNFLKQIIVFRFIHPR